MPNLLSRQICAWALLYINLLKGYFLCLILELSLIHIYFCVVICMALFLFLSLTDLIVVNLSISKNTSLCKQFDECYWLRRKLACLLYTSFISHPSHMEFSSFKPKSNYVTHELKQWVTINTHHTEHLSLIHI